MAKTDYIQIRIAPELKEKVQTLAAAENRTVSNYITSLIVREIEAQRMAENGYLMTKTHGVKFE